MRCFGFIVALAVLVFGGAANAQNVPHPVNGPAAATVGHCVQFSAASGNSVSDAGSTCGSGAFTAPTIAFAGDSITNYGGQPYTTAWMQITSTTAGNTSITLTNSYSGGFFAPGDIAYLCSTNANQQCAGGEQVTIGAYTGGGSTTLPITGTVANTGETFIQAYTSRLPSYNFQGWAFWANAISGWPLNITAMYGLPGATVQQIAGLAPYTDYLGVTTTQDQVARAIASGAKYIHILEGANDQTTGLSGADTDFAVLQTQIAEIQAAGDIPIIGTIPLNTSGSATAGQCPTPSVAQGNYVSRFNYKIRELAAYQNVIVIDYYRALTRPDTGNWAGAGTVTGNLTGWWGLAPGVSYTPDCTHPNYFAAAMAMARVFSDTMVASNVFKTLTASDGSVVSSSYLQHNIASQVGTVNFETMYTSTFGMNNAGNMIPNGGMSNAVGVGSVADSWSSVNGRTPSQGANVFSVYQQTAQMGNPYSRAYFQRITIPAGSDWGQAYVTATDVVSAASQTLNSSSWQPGDTIFASARVKMNCFSTTYQSTPTIAIVFQNGATVLGRTFGPAYKAAPATMVYPSEASVPDTGPDPSACPASAVLRTPNVVVPVGTTKIVMWLMLNGEGATADFTDAEMRKVL